MASTVWTCTVRATAPRAVTTERSRGEGFGMDLAGAGEQDVEVAVGGCAICQPAAATESITW